MTSGTDLALHLCPTGVHGRCGDRTTEAVLVPTTGPHGWAEVAPDALWRAVLTVARDLGPAADTLLLSADLGAVALWDRETLGSPRPVVAAGRRTAVVEVLTWVREHEPNTWALVADGRYAVGGLASYVLARATLGTWHVSDLGDAEATGLLAPDGAWDADLCARIGLPLDALPQVSTGTAAGARTEPRGFGGLDLRVHLGG